MSNEDRDGFEQDYEEIQNLIEEEDELLEDWQTEPEPDVEDDLPDDASEEQGKKPQKGPKWKGVVIAAAVLAVAAAVLLVLSKTGIIPHKKESVIQGLLQAQTETETAGPGEQPTEAEQPAPTATPSVTATPMPVQSETPEQTEASKPAGNTVVIPAQLVYVGSSPEELKHYAEEYGLKSVTLEADGSVKVLSETTVPSADVDALVAKISEKCSEPGWYFHFLSISANNDQTVFSIVVNELNMSDKEKQTVTDLFLTAGIHAVQSGHTTESLRIDLLNQVGDHIGTITTGPLKLGN